MCNKEMPGGVELHDLYCSWWCELEKYSSEHSYAANVLMVDTMHCC